MNEYHKIHTIYKRDPETKYKTLLIGEYSLPEFKYLRNNLWSAEEKVDGMNIRVIKRLESRRQVLFGGKTDKAQIPAHLVNVLNELFDFEQLEAIFPETDICLYGEGYGHKIQKGGKYIKGGVDFILFDVKIGHWWLKREDVAEIAHKLGISMVPIIGNITLDKAVEMTQYGFSSFWGDFIAEGMVLRPLVELKSRSGQRIITKIKYKDFN